MLKLIFQYAGGIHIVFLLSANGISIFLLTY